MDKKQFEQLLAKLQALTEAVRHQNWRHEQEHKFDWLVPVGLMVGIGVGLLIARLALR